MRACEANGKAISGALLEFERLWRGRTSGELPSGDGARVTVGLIEISRVSDYKIEELLMSSFISITNHQTATHIF
jgi:hypothetical protein